MEAVPVALACGHLVEGLGHYRWDPDDGSSVECPEGCGWQRYVVEPHDGEQRCLCPPLGPHVCGADANVTTLDLGELAAGDEVELGWPDGATG